MKKGKGYRFKKGDANYHVWASLKQQRPPTEQGVQPSQDVLGAMMSGMTGNAKDNCGTGAGGFKKGNTCASGGEVADSLSDLKDKLGLNKSRMIKINESDTAGYTTIDHRDHAVAQREYDRVTKLVTKMGFKPLSKTEGRLNGGKAVRYEHPHGHRLDVGLSNDREAFTWVQMEFVPKKFREALGLAEAALTASTLVSRGSEIPAGRAVTETRHGKSKEAMDSHKFMMDYHTRSLPYVKDPEVREQHERAITAHSIARDWHMDNLGVQNGWQAVANAKDNCGTGAGGFKKGNSCASGMSHITSVKGLTEALGLGGDPSNGTGGMLYTTKEYGQHEEAALEYQRQKRVAAKLGFKAKSSTAGSDGGEAVEYEHPEGHSLQIGLSNRVRHPYTHATIVHVSKAAREGLGLAEEAKKLSQKAIDATEANIGTMSEINQALAAARRGDSKMAKNYHEAMRDYHQRATTYTTTFKKLHERAAAAHSIARDWHMEQLGVTNTWVSV